MVYNAVYVVVEPSFWGMGMPPITKILRWNILCIKVLIIVLYGITKSKMYRVNAFITICQFLSKKTFCYFLNRTSGAM